MKPRITSQAYRSLLRAAAACALALAVCVTIASSAGVETAPGSSNAIRLEVDASHSAQKILRARLQIPVHPGPLKLYYPEWIPGEHMPDGPISNLTGLVFTAGGQRIPWQRDLIDSFTFHTEIPAGADSLDVALDFLLSAPASGYTAGASATAYLNLVSWNQVLLYPDTAPPRDTVVVPSMQIPDGWQFASALPGRQTGANIEFAPAPLDRLIDSPVLIGKYFRHIDLTPGSNPDHVIDIAADSQYALGMPGDMERHYRRLVEEAQALLGPAHYNDYHFLLTLSDAVAHFGLEHRESSDDRANERSLVDETFRIDFAGLLPHEYVHSWNGKYRRPIGVATQNYQQPMKDDLLWVYEGLTQYLGEVLTARSGLRSSDLAMELLAQVAAQSDVRAGRNWRSLQDTADAEPALGDTEVEWANWRRGTDYYEEGELLWLDVDGMLRKLTNDKESINTFCHLFFAGPTGLVPEKNYTFEDVVAELNAIAPYDWTHFLRERLDATPAPTPDEAIANSGWKLVYSDQPNKMDENSDSITRWITYSYSAGIILSTDGYVGDVTVDGAAYKGGLGPGMRVTAINGRAFSPEDWHDAIRDSRASTSPMQVTAMNGRESHDYLVDYHGGLRFPHIERDKTRPDYLSEILHPLAK
jgi:predicted metalloprotease with PDZ domain